MNKWITIFLPKCCTVHLSMHIHIYIYYTIYNYIYNNYIYITIYIHICVCGVSLNTNFYRLIKTDNVMSQFPQFLRWTGGQPESSKPKSTDRSTFSPLTLLLGLYIYPIFRHIHITLLVMCMYSIYIYNIYIGVSINGGTPNSWMVYSIEIPIL